jgi:hypothetical protein
MCELFTTVRYLWRLAIYISMSLHLQTGEGRGKSIMIYHVIRTRSAF